MRYPVIISMIIFLSLFSCMSQEQEHPDILFIAIDDLNDWTGYHNGEEELYDHERDPDEFIKFANQDRYSEVKNELNKWLPDINVPE